MIYAHASYLAYNQGKALGLIYLRARYTHRACKTNQGFIQGGPVKTKRHTSHVGAITGISRWGIFP